MSTEALGRVVIVIPTYNEADNLAWIVGRLRAAQPRVDILVVDDGSPDGTGRIADELAARTIRPSRCCTAARRKASALPTSPASDVCWTPATT